MQLKRQTNSTARPRTLVDRTKSLFCAITSAIKYPEPKVTFSLSGVNGRLSRLESLILAPSFAPPAFEVESPALADGESDREPALCYPTPPFARRFTSSSHWQHAGSTKSTTSTTNSSVFSRHTYQTATTVAGEGKELSLEKGDGIVAAEGDVEVGVGASGDESSPELSSEDDDDDEGVFFIRSKRVKPLQPGFVTSLPRNPYAAFLSQPLYKPPYIFPTARRSVDEA
ncbi:hypothetical protein FRC01_010274 [Tulasnella sp. 417]|nr:hypothetical protein FRC01_010274 [Tulasnella sp. 417]